MSGANKMAERHARALEAATRHLLELRSGDGHWEGHLSSSALSTATAISALCGADDPADAEMIAAGLRWLARTQNADGGWGDTPDSPSNLSTALLAACAIKIAAVHCPTSNVQCQMDLDARSATLLRAEEYITERAGATIPERVEAIRNIYGEDRTFAVPILMNCALAGIVPWSAVPPLPFELALFPRALYKAVKLHVVSYALPALIAVGAIIHRRNPTRNPLARALRNLSLQRVLGMLEGLQPASGGYLEATPLTSFVTMSLIPLAGASHPVAARALGFLRRSFRPDGSWPIDTHLATWVTTGAVAALERAGGLARLEKETTRRWIAAQQWRAEHSFTGAAPGGFAWSPLSGGVPDADDTAGAILALGRLGECDALPGAVKWLLDLQNSDGGWPTFCRGWGRLPFDKSAPDLTAHVLRALSHAAETLGLTADPRLRRALAHGIQYLAAVQRSDGSWVPLWFGNQAVPKGENPVLGTARVLLAWRNDCGLRIADCGFLNSCNPQSSLRAPNSALHASINPQSAISNPQSLRGVDYLVSAQNPDGGWGGGRGISSSVEETALALSALACYPESPRVKESLESGVLYLVGRVEDGSWLQAAPIGLYFASLWYSEVLYPVIWTVEALGATLEIFSSAECGGRSAEKLTPAL